MENTRWPGRPPLQRMGRLHIVSTPIGNLEDVTLRALRVLREADLVFAEDTRRTRILLDRHAIAARPRSLHAHNEASRTGEALAALESGGSVAIVSDAGTPLVSDPGARLVAAAIAAGHTVVSIPGPSAVLAALAVSGLPADAFTFLGFLPRRSSLRRERLERLREAPETLILFESPRRVLATLSSYGMHSAIARPASRASSRNCMKRRLEGRSRNLRSASGKGRAAR